MKTLQHFRGTVSNHRVFRPATLLLFAGILALLATEIALYPGIIHNNLGVPALGIALFPLVFRCVFGSASGEIVTDKWQPALLWFATMLFGLLFSATLLDYLVHPNYVFSTFQLHPTGLIPLAVFFALASYALISAQVAKNQFSPRVFVLPFWLFAFIFPHRWLYPETWVYLIKEDSIIEYLTMLMYLLASGIAFLSVQRLLTVSKKVLSPPLLRIALIFTLVAFGIGCFVIAGDEVSWGQRIFGIETPQNLAEVNTQGEINLHNNRAIYGRIYHVYNAVSFLGMTSWIARWAILKFAPKSIIAAFAEKIIPPWEVALFFLPSFLFTLLRTEPVHPEVIAWEETSELFLGAGFMMTALWICKRLKKS